jgi:hypothetical protein
MEILPKDWIGFIFDASAGDDYSVYDTAESSYMESFFIFWAVED